MSQVDRLICHVMPRAFVMALVAGAFAAVSQLGADPVREARVLDVVMAGLSTSAEISRTPAKRGRMQ